MTLTELCKILEFFIDLEQIVLNNFLLTYT